MEIEIKQNLDESEIFLLKKYFVNSKLNIFISNHHLETDGHLNCFSPSKVIVKSQDTFLEINNNNLLNHIQLITNQIGITKIEYLPQDYKLFKLIEAQIDQIQLYSFKDMTYFLNSNYLNKLLFNPSISKESKFQLSVETTSMLVFYSNSHIVFAIEANDGWDSCLTINFDESLILNNLILKKFHNTNLLKYDLLMNLS